MNTESIENDCIFCRIVAGSTPVEPVYDGGDTLFFHDISPKAKVHILGIPKNHLSSLSIMTAADQAIIGKLIHDATIVAKDKGIDEGGYRLVCNIGSDAGQVVKHVHIHILGGETLGPLRC